MVEASIAYGESLVKEDLPAKVDVGVWNFKTLMIPRSKQRPVVYYEITPAVGQEEQDNRISEWFGSKDPDSLCIAAGSLRDFYDFLHLHDNLKYPSITLSPDNNILASWRSEQNRVFSVHFLSNKDVRFVIFKPIKKYPDRKFRFSGAATIDTLMDEIPKDMLDWIT